MPPKKRTIHNTDGDVVVNAAKLLDGVVIALSGSSFTQSQGELISLVESIGAVTTKTFSAKVTHVLTTETDYKKNSVLIQKAKKAGIPIVREDFVHHTIDNEKRVKDDDYRLNKVEDDEEEEEEEEEVKTSTTSTTTTSTKKDVVESDDDESSSDEEAKRSTKKKKSAISAASASKKKELDEEKEKLLLAEKLADIDSDLDSDEDSDSDDDSNKTKIQIKGRAAVDTNYYDYQNYHVYDDGKDVYDATLNQTEISQNNNKFYIIQLLQSDSNSSKFVVWNRWGREGRVGESKDTDFNDFNRAKTCFCKKFQDKTSNRWDNRHNFVKVKGKYDMLEMDYSVNTKQDDTPKKKKKVVHKTECSLDERVQNFIKLIFDVKMMKQTLVEAQFDLKKSPLGKLSKNQIKKGYEALKEIEEELNGKKRQSELSSLSSKFYTQIPHDFGMRVPTVINNFPLLKQKIDMLANLADIEVATTLIKDSKDDESNVLEAYYKQLKSEIKPLDKNSDTYKRIVDYAAQSHDTNYFRFGLNVVDILEVEREGESSRFEPWKKNDNKMLLWHGSRLTNWCGIISQGLRIAPPDAPKTGYRFGKGIYFADCISKSASYCFTSRDKPTAVMILCEVALGKMNELDHDMYMEKAPTGTHSTKARGMAHPDPKDKFPIEQGLHIPGGNIVKSGLNTSCSHNEFIVYDVSQVKIRYILKVNVKN